jgi:hypothetical protein
MSIPRPFPRLPVRTCAFGSCRWKTTPVRGDRDPAETEPRPPAAGLRLDAMSSGRPCGPSSARARARSPSDPTCDPAEVSRVRGQAAFALPGAFRRDCSQRELRPDPIGSDTCCRRARRDVGWRGRPRRVHTCWRVPMTSPPGGPACAQARKRGPPDARFCRTPRRPRLELTKLLWSPRRAREPAWEGDRFHGRHRRQGRFTRRSAKRDALCRTRGAFHRCASPFENGLSPTLDPGSGSSPHVVPNLWNIAAGAFAFRA